MGISPDAFEFDEGPCWSLHGLYIYMVGGLEHEFYFPFHIWDVILPIDELIFFNMVKTTSQM